MAAPSDLGIRRFSMDQRLGHSCFLTGCSRWMSAIRGVATVAAPRLLGFAARIESLCGSRLRTWARSWRASTADHGGATVAPPSHLEFYRKTRESGPRCNVSACSELPSIVRRGSRVRNHSIRENGPLNAINKTQTSAHGQGRNRLDRTRGTDRMGRRQGVTHGAWGWACESASLEWRSPLQGAR
jgi:hypothetical protein